MGRPTDRLFGTLDLLVLRSLAGGEPLHGYDITERIKTASREALTMEEAVSVPALHRMEEAGWLKSHWDISANNRRARFYTITGKGRRYLKQLEADWIKHVEAVSRVLRTV